MARNRVGSVKYLGDGRYRIRVQRGTRPDGSPRARCETYEGTDEGAHIRAAAIAAEMGRTDAWDASVTLSDYYWGVFRGKPSNRGTLRSANTLSYYDGEMRRNVLPSLGDVPLDRITHAAMAACIRQSPSPVNTKRTLSAVMRSAYDDGLLAERPLDRRVPVARVRRPAPEAWSRWEAAAAFDAMREEGDDLMAYLVLGLSGLRKEEALGARPCDVRRESTYSFATGESIETLTVSVEWTYTDEGGHVQKTKNDQSVRSVPVLPVGREMLAEISRARSEDGSARIVRLTGDGLYKAWRAACERHGLRYIPPKMLRHTSDTLMLTAGVPQDLSDRMHGRAEHTSTYRSYFRPDISAMEDAAQRVSAIVQPQASVFEALP